MMTKAAVEAPRILVVDDQAGMRLSLKGILTKKGYAVSVAEDGATALEMVRQTQFRLILMDVKMPGLSGVETFIRVKAISPGTPVVMMTAFAAEEEIKQAIREGAYTIVHKPFEIDRMLDVIKDCLDGRTLVLIVDDQTDISSGLKILFESRGYRVGVVGSGEECISEVCNKRYEIILLDIKMPGIDGVETLRQVKQVRPDVGVIMMTGHAPEEMLQKALEEGSFAWVHKPLEIDRIIQVIDQCLKKAPGSGPADA
jgi:DNA-binding NtrC family response regulator